MIKKSYICTLLLTRSLPAHIHHCFFKNLTGMKKLFTLFAMAALVIVFACGKSSTTPSNNSTSLKFENLVANDTVLKVNGVTSITAQVQGDGLTYTWTASYGTFIGSGAKVQWTVCHSEKFTITCTVKDKNNKSDSKSVTIRTID